MLLPTNTTDLGLQCKVADTCHILTTSEHS